MTHVLPTAGGAPVVHPSAAQQQHQQHSGPGHGSGHAHSLSRSSSSLYMPSGAANSTASLWAGNAFGGTVRDLELLHVFSTESNPKGAVADLPQAAIAVICEFADEPELVSPLHDGVVVSSGPAMGDAHDRAASETIFDSLEAALLHDRPDMLPPSVSQRMYFARQSSPAAQSLAARLTWDEKIEYSYSPEWTTRDEAPVYVRIIERPGVYRVRQGPEATPVTWSAKHGVPPDSTPAHTLHALAPALRSAPPPSSMPLASDIVEMLEGTSRRIFRRSAVDGFPLYHILLPLDHPAVAGNNGATGTGTATATATGAVATGTATATGGAAAAPSSNTLPHGAPPLLSASSSSGASSMGSGGGSASASSGALGGPGGGGGGIVPGGGVWCLYLNSMYCPNTLPWSRALMKSRGFKLVGWFVPTRWATPEWMARAHALAHAKRVPSADDDEYDIHEQINDPATLDLPPLPPPSKPSSGGGSSGPAATTGATGTTGSAVPPAAAELMYTVRDCFDVDRHLPLLEALQQQLRRYLKEHYDLDYTDDSDELEVVFHYPVQPIFELLHFQLHYKSNSATYRHSTSHRLSHVVDALRARRQARDEAVLAALYASSGGQMAPPLTSMASSASSSGALTTRSRMTSVDAKSITPKGGLGSGRGSTLLRGAQKPVQSSFFIPSYEQTHATSASPFTEWTMFNSARAAIHPPHIVTPAADPTTTTAMAAAPTTASSTAASANAATTTSTATQTSAAAGAGAGAGAGASATTGSSGGKPPTVPSGGPATASALASLLVSAPPPSLPALPPGMVGGGGTPPPLPPLPPLLPGMIPGTPPPAPAPALAPAPSALASAPAVASTATTTAAAVAVAAPAAQHHHHHPPPTAFTFPLPAGGATPASPSGGAHAMASGHHGSLMMMKERERCLEYRALARHMIFHPFYGARVKRLRPFEYIIGWY